mmetsp:Transcript_89361/g.251628  ORF Transcript_89361/g.251628 Transcript_89361/m.251628 type:complete len:624 (+) Transcript_89361:34-1905(+)
MAPDSPVHPAWGASMMSTKTASTASTLVAAPADEEVRELKARLEAMTRLAEGYRHEAGRDGLRGLWQEREQAWRTEMRVCEARHESDAHALINQVEQLQGLLAEHIRSGGAGPERRGQAPARVGEAEAEQSVFRSEALEQQEALVRLRGALGEARCVEARQEREQQVLLQRQAEEPQLRQELADAQRWLKHERLQVGELRERLSEAGDSTAALRAQVDDLRRQVREGACRSWHLEADVLRRQFNEKDDTLRITVSSLKQAELGHARELVDSRAAAQRELCDEMVEMCRATLCGPFPRGLADGLSGETRTRLEHLRGVLKRAADSSDVGPLEVGIHVVDFAAALLERQALDEQRAVALVACLRNLAARSTRLLASAQGGFSDLPSSPRPGSAGHTRGASATAPALRWSHDALRAALTAPPPRSASGGAASHPMRQSLSSASFHGHSPSTPQRRGGPIRSLKAPPRSGSEIALARPSTSSGAAPRHPEEVRPKERVPGRAPSVGVEQRPDFSTHDMSAAEDVLDASALEAAIREACHLADAAEQETKSAETATLQHLSKSPRATATWAACGRGLGPNDARAARGAAEVRPRADRCGGAPLDVRYGTAATRPSAGVGTLSRSLPLR